MICLMFYLCIFKQFLYILLLSLLSLLLSLLSLLLLLLLLLLYFCRFRLALQINCDASLFISDNSCKFDRR